tara:strand:+ start:1223 stop:1906 length:684 start_codon:yes stop_codon:yes gene_type:complete
MDLKKQILVALGLDNQDEVNLEFQAKLEDGTIIVSTAKTLEAGSDISVLTEDGSTMLLPVGKYKTEDGLAFSVDKEGIVAELYTDEVEKETEGEPVEEGMAEDDGKEADVEDWAGMEKRIQNLEDAVADLKKDKEGGDDESEEMAEETVEPSTNPKSIKTTEVKEFSVEEELENLKTENEKLKTELAEQPAESPINTNKFSSERATPTKRELQRMTKQEKYLYNLYK